MIIKIKILILLAIFNFSIVNAKNIQLTFNCGSGFSKVGFSKNQQAIILISHLDHDHIQGLIFNSFAN